MKQKLLKLGSLISAVIAITFGAFGSILIFNTQKASAAPARCFYETGDDAGIRDCSDFPAPAFPGGQVQDDKCYIITGFLPGVGVSEVPCTDSRFGGSTPPISDPDGQKIIDWLQDGINLLTALAGLAITAAVIVGGIQYSTAGGNPQAAAAAKKRITNAMLALLALVFLYTFLQWLVPGGIFR